MPASRSIDPGLFVQQTIPVGESFRVISGLRDVLDKVAQSNATTFFAQMRKEMEGLAEASQSYTNALKNPVWTTLMGGGSGGHRFFAGAAEMLHMPQLAKNERARAEALDERSAVGSLFGNGAGFNVNDISQVAGAGRYLDKTVGGFTQTMDYLRGMQVADPQSRLDLGRKGMQESLPAIVGLGAEQFRKIGIDPDEIKSYEQLAVATDKLTMTWQLAFLFTRPQY